MRTRNILFTACSATLLLAACGNYEDASAEAEADTVEIPANEPLESVTAMPVADPEANTNVEGADLVDPAEADAANGDEVTDAETETTDPVAPPPAPAN